MQIISLKKLISKNFIIFLIVFFLILIIILLLILDPFRSKISVTNLKEYNSENPPLFLENLGFNLDYYNPKTNTSGDIKFSRINLITDQIFAPFGQQDPRTPDPTKKNPQIVVILPLNTNVLSLVDGEVIDIKDLYSGDASLWVSVDNNSKWIYELEHIKNLNVKIGDKVKAGQIVGKVSDYDSRNTPGFGLVEIGILHTKSNGIPEHVCPTKYLDNSVKENINSKLLNLYSEWNKYLGKIVYTPKNYASPGCVTEESVNG